MHSYLKQMEANLTAEEKYFLQRIYEPTVVATPLSVSRRDICILPDGEIRCYGILRGDAREYIQGPKTYGYLSSRDAGLSWKINYAKGKMHACTYFEEAQIYIGNSIVSLQEEPGMYIRRSKIGPDDPEPEEIKIDDKAYGDVFLPVKSAFSNRIWFTAQERTEDNTPIFFYSDDFGLTWQIRKLGLPKQQEVVYPHKGPRWSVGSGTEPYAVELSENKMMMIVRNSTDSFYQSFSYDGGDTWTDPEPSTFYGSNTTAFFLRLSDGRVVTFWNNTKPLPDLNKKNMIPPVGQHCIDGIGEDVFTNRDAAHAAITEDGGETWLGYREILLNPIRNAADFRYFGGVKSSNDKSVHQFQAYELPFHKILVSSGQNVASRRMLIFDVNWLYEQERTEDFLTGLGNVSTQVYVKSISGCTSHHGNGHCAWNRTNGALMMPDPDGGFLENVLVSKHHDDRLFNDNQGIVWNFPMAKQGNVTVELKLLEKQARFVLTDRWYNPCDPTAAWQSPFFFELDPDDIGSAFSKIDIQFDTETAIAQVFANGQFLFKVAMTKPCPTGISYLMLQCVTDGDSQGFYVKRMEKH